MKGAGKGNKGVHETDGNGEEDVSISNHSNEKQFEESSQLLDVLPEHLVRCVVMPSFSEPKKQIRAIHPKIYTY